MPVSSSRDRFNLPTKLVRGAQFRGALAGVASTLLAFVFVGLVYNAIIILRLPQSGLKLFEIIWVSFTACLVIIALAMAIAAGLESLGQSLRPKPRGEQWLREEVRRHRIAGMEVATPEANAPRAGTGKAGAA